MEAEAGRLKSSVVVAIIYLLFDLLLLLSSIELLMIVRRRRCSLQIIYYTAFPYSYLFPAAAALLT